MYVCMYIYKYILLNRSTQHVWQACHAPNKSINGPFTTATLSSSNNSNIHLFYLFLVLGLIISIEAVNGEPMLHGSLPGLVQEIRADLIGEVTVLPAFQCM